MTKRFRSMAPLALVLCASLANAPREAQALTVEVDGTTYDLTIYSGSFDSNTSFFATPANGGKMSWWGNESLAQQLASKLAAGLSSPPLPSNGPLFAFAFNSPYVSASYFDLTTLGNGDLVVTDDEVSPSTPQTYVVENNPVPAPLPILATAVCFTAIRRLRRLSSIVERHHFKR